MKYLLLILAVLLAAGCQLLFDDYSAYWNKEYDVPPIQYAENTVAGIARWVADWVTYTSDKELYGEREEWATPEQTYWNRRGDCEDFTILLMYLLHRDLGLEPKMILGKFCDIGHSWVSVDGEWWEAIGGHKIENRTNYSKDKTLDYAEALGMADEWRALNLPVID